MVNGHGVEQGEPGGAPLLTDSLHLHTELLRVVGLAAAGLVGIGAWRGECGSSVWDGQVVRGSERRSSGGSGRGAALG